MNAVNRTFYDVLGVSRDTPPIVIKAAYRALAKEYHPDSSSEAAAAPERFHELLDAYAVLSDPEARHAYDGALTQPAEAASGVTEPHEQLNGAREGGGTALDVVQARFMLYSEQLAAAFQEALATERGEDDLLAFAQVLEAHFLREYFGADDDVCAMAGLLLLQCRKRALIELNELVQATAELGAAERRRRLAAFAERNFNDSDVFSGWLRERFRSTPGRPVSTATHPVRASEPIRLPQRGRPLTSMARVFCWTFAVYLGICIVSVQTG